MKRRAELDGLRAVAILMVLVAHIVRTRSHAIDAGRAAIGEIGVSIFFVLSGYLITTLLLAERNRSGTIDLRAFFVRRARRIFPAYYTYLGVIAILAAFGKIPVSARELAIDACYLRDYSADSFVWLQHTWSLAVETQFYFLWPPAIRFLSKRNAVRATLACIVVAPLVRVATYALLPAQRPLMTIAFHTRVDMLMFGCGLALVLEAGPPVWLERAYRAVPAPAAIALLIACILGAAALHGAFTFTIGMTIQGVAIALLLASVLHAPGGSFARALSTRPLAWIGLLSYSLYLWQQPFLLPLDDAWIGRFPIDVFAAFAVACVSYYGVERTFFRARPIAPAASS